MTTSSKLLTVLLLIGSFYRSAAQTTIIGNPSLRIQPVETGSRKGNLGPVLIDGMLWFSALNKANKSIQGMRYFFDLYQIPMNEFMKPLSSKLLDEPINGPYHDGPVAYCRATEELFITRSGIESLDDQKNKGIKRVRLKIEVCRYIDGKWVYIESLPFNHSQYSVGHPAINSTGDTLVFVSDMPGGYGKTDLYRSIRKNGIWQAPQNLGPQVNTRKREVTPFINTDGTLFFASDGHHGRGGFDLYSSKIKSGKYTKAQNLNKSINSRDDDYGLVLHHNQKVAFLVSNRKRNKDRLWCLKTNDFKFEQMPQKKAEEVIANAENEAEQFLGEHVKSEKDEAFITSNLSYKSGFEVTDKDHIPDVKATFSYTITSDTLKLKYNTYNLNHYTVTESNAVVVLLDMIRKSFDGELSPLMGPGKVASITITGNEETFAFYDNIRYNGEFGDEIKGMCCSGNKREMMSIDSYTKIDSRLLTFLRLYGIGQAITNEIDAFGNSRNQFFFKIIPAGEIKYNKEWVKIELTIHNAFCNF